MIKQLITWLYERYCKEKPSRSMIEAYWLSCFSWGLGGVAVTLAALRFGGVI